MMIGPDQAAAFVRPFASLASLGLVTRRLARYGRDRLRYRRGTEIGNGNALVARFLASLRQYSADIWTGAPLVELISEDGRVTGAIVSRNGTALRVRARQGVVLATGGFPWNARLRDSVSARFPHAHSMAAAENTGDGTTAALQAGAQFDSDLASPALWTPASLLRGRDGRERTIIYGYLDRGRPGVIAVNPAGRRFVNESNSYHDIVMAMFASGNDGNFHFICDRNFVRRNGLGAIRPFPWSASLASFERRGYIATGATLAELAGKIGLDAAALHETVARHNDFARTGIDLDFAKGSTAYNRSWGDPEARPNPNLTPIAQPPFVALRIVPASLGTVMGLATNEDAAVLDRAGTPIPGLFACGNDMASAMRGHYPGGGVSLGPAVVFAYRAIERITREPPRQTG